MSMASISKIFSKLLVQSLGNLGTLKIGSSATLDIANVCVGRIPVVPLKRVCYTREDKYRGTALSQSVALRMFPSSSRLMKGVIIVCLVL